MKNTPISLGTSVISAGTTTGTAITTNLQFLSGIAIAAPAALTQTCNVEVSLDGGSTYQILQSGGSDVTVGAGDCIVIDVCAFEGIRIKTASGNEASERTFVFKGVEELT